MTKWEEDWADVEDGIYAGQEYPLIHIEQGAFGVVVGQDVFDEEKVWSLREFLQELSSELVAVLRIDPHDAPYIEIAGA